MNKKQIEDYVTNDHNQELAILKERIKDAKDECTKIREEISKKIRTPEDIDSVIYFNGLLGKGGFLITGKHSFFLFYVMEQL